MSMLASKSDFATLKTKVDNLDVDKLKTVPADSSGLKNVLDNDVTKKTIYDKFVVKVKTTDIKIQNVSGLVTKTNCNSEQEGLEKKIREVDKIICNTSGLIRNTNYNAKITEIEKKILRVTGLITTDTLNTKPILILLLRLF